MASFIFSDWFTSCFDWDVSVGVSCNRRVHVRLHVYKPKISDINYMLQNNFTMLIENFIS